MIDLHAHLLTPAYRKALQDNGVDHPDGMPTLPDWSVAAAVQLMDEVGIEAQVLSVSSPGLDPVPARERVALARVVNDEGLAVVAAQPGRFGYVATLPLPDVDEAVAEAARCLDLGADGVGLHTHSGSTYLGDPLLSPLLHELDRRAALVTIHPVSPCGWEQVSFGRPRPMLEFLFDTTRAVVNLLLSGSLEAYPDIRWVVPHAGAVLPVVADRVALFGGIDAVSALQRLWYDLAGVPVPRALSAIRTLVGDDRLVYGSDFPFTPAPAVAGLARVLAPEVDRSLLRATAARLVPRLA